MQAEIVADVGSAAPVCEISEDDIAMERYGMEFGSATWTYLVQDSANQFSRLPQLIQAMAAPVKRAATKVSNWTRR